MWSLRHYLPLFGFIIPTVAVGYGMVIPPSCIAGVNELTLGFASTNLGAALTYVAGSRRLAWVIADRRSGTPPELRP